MLICHPEYGRIRIARHDDLHALFFVVDRPASGSGRNLVLNRLHMEPWKVRARPAAVRARVARVVEPLGCFRHLPSYALRIAIHLLVGGVVVVIFDGQKIARLPFVTVKPAPAERALMLSVVPAA